jgi:hypothetical protein
LPACHFVTKASKSSWFAAPTTVIGVVLVSGWPKMSRKTWKFSSGSISDDISASDVVGTLRIPFVILTSAPVSVARYFSSSHASSGCFEVFGMPTILPVVYPEP